MSLVSFLVSILNLAPNSRLRQLSLRSRFADVSGLVSGLDSQYGSELPFVTTVDQIELRGCAGLFRVSRDPARPQNRLHKAKRFPHKAPTQGPTQSPAAHSSNTT